MLTVHDLIRLPYTHDLTQAGVNYACRSFPYTYDRMGGDPFNRLRRIASGKAVELAFRRYLHAQGVPFDNAGATPFTEPDRYDVAIGGRRCDLKSFQFFHKDRIRALRRNPQMLMEAQALVPEDQANSDQLEDEGVYIFAFLAALVAPGPADLQAALLARQPIFLLYPLPGSWARPEHRGTLGSLALKTENPASLELELGGQDAEGAFQSESVRLFPRQRLVAQKDFWTLAYMRSLHLPAGRIGVHSPRLGDTLLIQPGEWSNIWIYGIEIFLAGYLSRGEFRRQAELLPAGSWVLQYPHTRTSNLAVPLTALRPLPELFATARK